MKPLVIQSRRKELYLGVKLALMSFCVMSTANAIPEVDRSLLDKRIDIIETTDKVTIRHDDNAVIHWNNFDLSYGETAEFINGGALSLNKVVGSGRSLINGTIRSDGRVAIINSNGVVFGSGAVVNVGGLIVSGIDAKIGDANSDSLNIDIVGGSSVSIPGSFIGTVENNGTIEIHGDGGVVLVG